MKEICIIYFTSITDFIRVRHYFHKKDSDDSNLDQAYFLRICNYLKN